MTDYFLEPTEESAAALLSRNVVGEVLMLNLLRFREEADYTNTPEIAPADKVSGREAYQKYMELAAPILHENGGELMLLAEGGRYFIGPETERWDLVVLVRQRSVSDFMGFVSHQEYLACIGHRTAALEDSRLLPLVEFKDHK